METQNANVIKGEAKSIEPRGYNTEAIKRRCFIPYNILAQFFFQVN